MGAMVNSVIGLAVIIAAIYFGHQAYNSSRQKAYRINVAETMDRLGELKEHAKEFTAKEIIKVTDDIYMAIGYALANSIMIIGPDGVVIVDVTESYQAAKEIYAEFHKITDKPITDIIYTHNHGDHIGGALAFTENEKAMPNIWAHSAIVKALRIWYTSGTNIIYFIRALRQFGVYVPDLSAGIGFKLQYGRKGTTMAPHFPTRFVNESVEDVNLAGLPMQIVHIPGETDDQIGVWVPHRKAFLCADDIYKAFPNLYAIRGTTNRNALQWVSSIDRMIDLEPDMLVPSHTRPIIGKDIVLDLLTAYRDAIQFVHDQTVRLANAGYHPDEIARELRMPEELASNPFLKEFYGTVHWSSKSVFLDYLGWFSGDPVELSPLTRSEKSERMIDLVGIPRLTEVARSALDAGDFQWALELSTHVIRHDPSQTEARKINVEALVSLGSRQTSANGRHYYLTSAMEAANEIKLGAVEGEMAKIIDAFPITMSLDSFSILFKSKECEKVKQILHLEITDTNSHHFIQIRNGVAVVKHRAPKTWNYKLMCTESTWKDVMTGRKNILGLIKSGDIKAEGTNVAIAAFLKCFDKDFNMKE